MDLTAQYVDGKLLTQKTQTTEQTSGAGKNSLDKDAFLQLLVAQMKYQDPLEPTSNTEYISQYATFSELEQMQNMSSGMTLSRASEMVGKEVIIESTSDSGKVTTVQGVVEKVVYNGNKAFLSVNGSLYSVDDVKQIVDDAYKLATEYVKEIEKIMKDLPKVENLTLADAGKVTELYNYFQNVNAYNDKLIDAETKAKINKYIDRMTAIVKEAQEAAQAQLEETLSEENNE